MAPPGFSAATFSPRSATAYVQGIRYDDIRAGLLSFFPSPALTPGRLNLMRVGRGRLLVDYAHNAAAVAGLMELVMAMDAGRRVGVVTAPGRPPRRRSPRARSSRCHARSRDPEGRQRPSRSRRRARSSALVSEGLVAGGLSDSEIEVVAEELDAVDRAIALLDDRDIGVILADDVPGVLEHLRMRSQPAAVS